MANDILVSPLGRAPGAVSGVYFALQVCHKMEIAKVITVGTSHPDVVSAANHYLGKLFPYLHVEYDSMHIPALDLRGKNREIMPYVAMIGLALEQAQQTSGQVHVAVTGGRSGMGALAALATNLYGADHLWHLWVHQRIEDGGTVDKLTGLTDPAAMARSPFLNPTVESDACELVELPFLDLRPLHRVLWDYRRTGEVPDPKSPTAALFARAGIQSFTQVFPASMTFDMADEVMRLKSQYAQATPREQERIMVDLGILLQSAGIVNGSERQQLIDLVASQAAPQALIDLAQRAQDRPGFWKWLGENKDAIASFNTLAQMLFEALKLWFNQRAPMP